MSRIMFVKKRKRRKKETTTWAWEVGVGSNMDSDLSHEWMHGDFIEKKCPFLHQLDQEFENILEN